MYGAVAPEGAFQSTLPARGATIVLSDFGNNLEISIHAPRTGSDATLIPCTPATWNFNPRSPHGERRVMAFSFRALWHFNPRSPHGERPTHSLIIGIPRENFNPRSPHGERHQLLQTPPMHRRISIHAPRTGSDAALKYVQRQPRIFQSTLPARGATRAASRRQSRQQFQSTLPARGATPRRAHARKEDTIFQSTLPARGATHGGFYHRHRRHDISIHAPRTGSDVLRGRAAKPLGYFNPRSPHGERQHQITIKSAETYFNPRSPHGERQRLRASVLKPFTFQSTLPARGATGYSPCL